VFPEPRRNRILMILGQRQRAPVDELASELGVSRETVRRDLARLEEAGLLRKVHGGAVALLLASEANLVSRSVQLRLEKQWIAERAATLFQPGDSLFVDAGSTTTAFAGALASAKGLTVVTNSIDVALRLGGPRSSHRVHLLGGDVRAADRETVGPETIDQIGRFRPRYAVLTVGAIDLTGEVFDFDPEEASVARAMIGQVQAVIVLADHSKFGRPALLRICHLRQVSRLITDRPPDAPMRRTMKAGNTELIVAGPGDDAGTELRTVDMPSPANGGARSPG
jgi:DeoR family transcriptional regulator, glycerol-3-phosphate regulon repressor